MDIAEGITVLLASVKTLDSIAKVIIVTTKARNWVPVVSNLSDLITFDQCTHSSHIEAP